MWSSDRRLILHVDMDAFFASVEELDNPGYKGKPLIIGGDPKGGRARGVVSTCNYEARKYGVHSAMPLSRAYRLCPHGNYLPVRMSRYAQLSYQVMSILLTFTPVLEQVSIDEAFLDCTGSQLLFGDATSLSKKIKDKIKDECGLTASVGCAANKLIAKIASDMQKPDGLTICYPDTEREFLSSLPIERLWGVGAKSSTLMHKLGYHTIGDLAKLSEDEVLHTLGHHGLTLHKFANGIDDRNVNTNKAARKSISEEHTYPVDEEDIRNVEHTLKKICYQVAAGMRKEHLAGWVVQLKIRLTGFETYHRSRKLSSPIQDGDALYKEALKLFRKFDRKEKRVRLIGAGMSQLEHAEPVVHLNLKNVNLKSKNENPLYNKCDLDVCEQLALFPEQTKETNEHKNSALIRETLLDELRLRFGEKVTLGSLIEENDDKK